MTKNQLEKLRMLIEHHIEDGDELGQAARELLPVLDGPAHEPTVMQPIATAPKDGTPILGYSDSDFFHGRKTRFAVVHYASEMQGWSMPGVGGLSITHWSPLPEWQTL